MTPLEQECVRRIAAAKTIPEDSVTLETTLDSLQVDSLDRMTLSFDLEEQYGVELSESQLHEIQTVGDVAVAVHRALQKKQAVTTGDADAA